MKVSALLESMPGVGRVRARQIMEEVGISESRRVRGLGPTRSRPCCPLRPVVGAVATRQTPPAGSSSSPDRPPSARAPSRPTSAQHYPEVWLSVSATTRTPRPGEVDGVHYHFVDDAEFERMAAAGELLEWAVVHGRGQVRHARAARSSEALAAGPRRRCSRSTCRARARCASTMPEALFVFLAPPSWDELVRRLVGRGTEDRGGARGPAGHRRVELAAAEEFDVTIVNDDVRRAAEELVSLMRIPAPHDGPTRRTRPNETRLTVSGTKADPIGITNPPIDDLLTVADSKYALVIYSAKRARQINAYYSQLQEGLLEYVGPLVETAGAREADVDRAARDQRGPADLHADRGLSTGRPGVGQTGVRIVLGVGGGIAAYKACSLLRLFTEAGHDVTVVPTAAALQLRRRRHLGGAVRQAGRTPTCGPTSTRCRTCGIGQQADLVVVAPATADLLARAAHGLADDLLTNTLLTARCPVRHGPGHAHRDVGAPGHPGQRRHAARARRARHRPRRRAG